jgi:serine/threonine-protein kinase
MRVALESDRGGRFLPGTMFGGRYRLVGPLGRGGMGEVYRADDLKLGQPVALKFLPADVERDPDRLERFLTEVRLSLRVTHPNVCRVFDVAQIDQRHFLSMEYVDGEDLSSLLRRIGRLPEDKAIEIARQLCAGLAAAHEEGVLHRDLKPANIMIDGRGRAKIADFGLAGATEGISGGEARAGTPQYMAPEQVAGRELSERTDLYAVGLVLYEMFTGKRAFELRTLEDLQRLQSSTPTSPSSHVSGLNPLVERAILRCLDPDPSKRPPSANALAAALPGGDPLAMAVAAGDTPSPEMVAAAGADTGLRPAAAGTLLAITVAGMVAITLLAPHFVLFRLSAPVKPPAVFVDSTRQLLRATGFAPGVDDAWGLTVNFAYLNHMSAGRAADPYAGVRAHGATFWYRESPVLIERLTFLNPDMTPRVGMNDPRMRYSGEVRVQLDREGRLIELTAMPPQLANDDAASREVDWPLLFRASGLDPAAWVETTPRWTPLHFGDRQHAWVPRDSARISGDVVRVEAASFQGRPVSYDLIYPWTVPNRMLATRRSESERIGDLILVLIFTALMVGSALVARRNMKLDRIDRRGAVRVASVVMTLLMVIWAVEEDHVPSIWELYLFLMAAGWALFIGALLGVIYLALEPYVRRLWPTTIMSWSRVLAGTIRDPLVARDVLIGCAAGAVLGTLEFSGYAVTRWVSGLMPRAFFGDRALHGPLALVSEVPQGIVNGIFIALVMLFVLLALRKLLRWESLAIAVATLLFAVPGAMGNAAPAAALPFALVSQALVFLMVARVGLVSAIAMFFFLHLLYSFPATWPPNQWYSGVGLAGIAVVAAVAVAAFRVAIAPHLAARPERTRAPAV